jgi:signal transduction histidine kinase/CheY-like chemotaxis protein
MKNNKEFKKQQAKRFLIMRVIVIILAIAITISTVIFVKLLNVKLFKERQSHLQEITVKVTEVLDTKIESLQERAITAKRLIAENGDMSDKEELFSLLEKIADIIDLGDARLLAFDDSGMYYTSDYLDGRWDKLADLATDDPMPVIRELPIEGTTSTYMVFFGKLKDDIAVGGIDGSIIQTAILMPLDTMKEVFTISGFDDNCFTYLVNSDGRRLYMQTFSQDFIDEFNVLTALENDTFTMEDTIDDLRTAVEERGQLCTEFECSAMGNERYFVSTVPLSNSEWTVLLFVPTVVLGVGTKSFVNYVVAYFTIIVISLIIIFGFLVYVFAASKNDRKLLRQQEENNILLAKAADEANSANAAKSEFLAHMSHDIRTPINGIMGMTNIALKNKDNNDKVVDCLYKISSSADHLLTLVNDVLDMSKIESGKVVMVHEPLDVRTMIDNCASIIGGQIMTRELTFEKEFTGIKHPYVLGDELHIRQILINILSNAVKFTPDGGTITFRASEVSCTGDKATFNFEVEDNGIGMSEEFQDKIFDAFAQEDNKGSRTNYMGTGLGMTITKQFVDLMGGTISIKSKLSEGSCFTVTLELDINPEKKDEVVEVVTKDIGGMKLLLVEDNLLNMEIAQEILEDEGAIITTAENGEIALETFTGSEPSTFDAILMDIMMPVMNGLDATKAIRASSHPEAKTIPIIAMTANAYAEDVKASFEAGMNAHIAKPINVPLLISTLNKYKKC